jgi:hypothetical protein
MGLIVTYNLFPSRSNITDFLSLLYFSLAPYVLSGQSTTKTSRNASLGFLGGLRIVNRTYAKKGYNLDGMVRAYRRLAKPIP